MQGANKTAIPRTGLELLVSKNAQQYIVATVSGDTILLQDIDGNYPTIIQTRKRKGDFGLTGLEYKFAKANSADFENLGLLFYRLDTYDPNKPVSINCSLISDILDRDSLSVGIPSQYTYGAELFHEDKNYNTNTEYYYSNFDTPTSLKIIEKTPLSTDASGCTTYRVRGTLVCNTTVPPYTCGFRFINLSFCINAVF